MMTKQDRNFIRLKRKTDLSQQQNQTLMIDLLVFFSTKSVQPTINSQLIGPRNLLFSLCSTRIMQKLETNGDHVHPHEPNIDLARKPQAFGQTFN